MGGEMHGNILYVIKLLGGVLFTEQKELAYTKFQDIKCKSSTTSRHRGAHSRGFDSILIITWHIERFC